MAKSEYTQSESAGVMYSTIQHPRQGRANKFYCVLYGQYNKKKLLYWWTLLNANNYAWLIAKLSYRLFQK